MSRAERRNVQRFLRRRGCSCTIKLEQTPGRPGDPTIAHHRGCPLGDAMLVLNRAGIMPAIAYSAPARCER